MYVTQYEPCYVYGVFEGNNEYRTPCTLHQNEY